jgi:DNA primase
MQNLPPARTALSLDRNSPAALDTHRVLEIDLLRWLVLKGERFLPTARYYLSEKHFWTPSCRSLYLVLLEKGVQDLLSIASSIEDHSVIDEILRKKINQERAELHFLHTVQKMLDREWLQEREAIKREIQQESHSEQKVLELAREFDALKQQKPVMQGIV